MNEPTNEDNPLRAAITAGLSFPIHAKIVGANGTTSEVLFESAEECHTLSMQLPLEFPWEWTLAGSNQLKTKFTQTAANTEELFGRVQKGAN
jgi:hypothetical protein